MGSIVSGGGPLRDAQDSRATTRRQRGPYSFGQFVVDMCLFGLGTAALIIGVVSGLENLQEASMAAYSEMSMPPNELWKMAAAMFTLPAARLLNAVGAFSGKANGKPSMLNFLLRVCSGGLFGRKNKSGNFLTAPVPSGAGGYGGGDPNAWSFC